MNRDRFPSGQYDRKIIIEQLTVSQDADYASEVRTYSTFLSTWAKVIKEAGREIFAARQLNAEIDTIFQIRWTENMKSTMRISYNNEYYYIYFFREVGRKEAINIYTKARRQ